MKVVAMLEVYIYDLSLRKAMDGARVVDVPSTTLNSMQWGP